MCSDSDQDPIIKKDLSGMSLEQLWKLFPIILKPYDPRYPEWYSAEKSAVEAAAAPYSKRISHIGSTAVPGLLAKPTVDILLEIDPAAPVETLLAKLKAAGWTLMAHNTDPDLKISLNKGYTPEGFAPKVFHLHVRFPGDWDELYFRDYQITHPDIAAAYAELKQSLLGQYEHDRDGYTNAKTDFIARYTKLARAEFGGRYRPQADGG